MDDASPLPPPIATAVSDNRQPVARWRWWIHLILIGGYILPRIALGLEYPRDNPALSNSTTGLILVSLLELSVFALVFGVACLISRPTREQLFLPWRPGWWVFPLGIGYSVAIRLAAAIAILGVVVIMIATHVFTPASAQQFMMTNRPDVEKLVDVEAMRHNPAYFWLTITLVSFVVAGLREELWRAGTLAAMKALWPRAFNSLGGQIDCRQPHRSPLRDSAFAARHHRCRHRRYTRIISRHHYRPPPLNLAGGDCARNAGRDDFRIVAVHHAEAARTGLTKATCMLAGSVVAAVSAAGHKCSRHGCHHIFGPTTACPWPAPAS